jgi:hypothetical protein
MKVQVFRASGELCFTAPTNGFLYKRLLQYAPNTQHLERFQLLSSDFEMDQSDVRLLVERTEADLRVMLRELRSHPKPDVPRSHLVRVTILGEQVRLYPRLELHSELLALHRAFMELVRAEQEGGTITVYLVPPVSSAEYRLLHVLKRAPDGVRRPDLKDAIVAEYDRLLASEVSEELRREFAAQRDSVTDATASEAVDVLSRWNLLTEDEPHENVMATEKLRRIRL